VARVMHLNPHTVLAALIPLHTATVVVPYGSYSLSSRCHGGHQVKVVICDCVPIYWIRWSGLADTPKRHK
jgi:hypothetical protein